MQDLLFAARSLVKAKGLSGAAVLTLGLGIGANTAIFSVLHAAFFARYEIEDPDRLLRVYGEDPARGLRQLNLSVPKFQLVREQQRSFSGIGAANYSAVSLLHAGEAEQVAGASITPGFLEAFGARPLLGRFFETGEEGDAPVAVISETLWRRRYAADPGVVGKTLALAGASTTIVGVAPRLPAFWQAEVWLTNPFQLPGIAREVLQRGVSFLGVVGRLRPGVRPEAAAQELRLIAARYREGNAEKADATWQLVPFALRDDIVGGSRAALLTLLGAVGLVLLIACSNVANLLLVRFTGRSREIALRSALGASRARVVRQFLTESLLVSALAGILGCLLALSALPIVVRLADSFLAFSGDIQLNLPVLAATLLVALSTGLAMGLYPALQASRHDVAAVLREGGRAATGSRGQQRVRSLLVTSQVAVSLLLLVGASLLLSSFVRLQRQPTGFRPDGVFVANVTLAPARYPDAVAQVGFFLRLAEELRAAPGVTHAGLIQGLPLSQANSRAPYARADGDVPPLKDRPLGLTRSVTPGYFETLGIPLLAGRDFGEQDGGDAPLVVIVSRATGRKLFPGEDPLGRRVIMGSRDGGQPMEVVGVVGDIRSRTLADTEAVEFYRPVMQRSGSFMQMAVRTRGEPSAFAGTARGVLRRLDPELPLSGPTTLAGIVSQSLGQQRLLLRLLGAFAGLALLLSLVGIYGVVAYGVRQRLRDIGVRLALGARPQHVVALMLAQGMAPVGLGLAAGLAGCLVLGRLVRAQLYAISPSDPATLGGAALSLAVVAALACWLPARQAAGVDPVAALRSE